MLNSFLVHNFRGFRRLTVERLGRVNLIVGKNTVGKTTLLEALWLYAARVRPEAVGRLLAQRQEFLAEREQEGGELEVDVSALFYGRDYRRTKEDPLILGPVEDSSEQISARMTWVEREVSSELSTVEYHEVHEDKIKLAEGSVFRALSVACGDEKPNYVRLAGTSWRNVRSSRIRRSEGLPPFLRAEGPENEAVGRWWDAVALKESEERVLDFVRVLAPIERITLVEGPRPYQSRIFVARLAGNQSPQPLKSLGEGVERVFRTALALEYTRRSAESTQPTLFPVSFLDTILSNVLFIDEFESGIHYSAIGHYWHMVFALAREFGVQVFATTHSWDCITAFQSAAVADPGCDGVLIRLEASGEKTRSVTFDEKELAIATRENIEVR